MALFRDEVLTRKVDHLQGGINLALPVSWQLLANSIAASVAVAAIFLASATYSRSETAKGTVIPENGMLSIVPSRAGLLETLTVVEGQAVHRGDVLARIRVENADANGSGTQTAILNAIHAQEDSLATQLESDASAAASEQAAFEAQLVGLRREAADLEKQIVVQKRLLAITAEDQKRVQSAAAQGFISRRDIIQREKELLSGEQQLASLQQNQDAKASEIHQTMKAQRQAASRAAAAAAELASSKAGMARERATAEDAKGYSLIAPADGRVAGIASHPGEIVTPPTPVMVLLPAKGQLLAEFLIPAKAIGFIRPGQTVHLKLDAYPSDRFGTIEGRITAISTVPVMRSLGGPALEPVYIGKAQPKQLHLMAYGKRQPLLPGMTLTARVITQRRSLIQWLFDPLFAAAHP